MEKINSRHHPNLLSIVIPAYNEEDGIDAIIQRVLAVGPDLSKSGIDMELIIVDDGSKDRTAEMVKTCDGVLLIRHPINKGYGAALKTGFQGGRGELLAFLDADGTYPPEYFPELCQAALGGADLVVGSRRSGASSEMPVVRRIGNMIWASLVSLLSGQRVNDPASGMRVLRAAALERLYPLPDGLNFTPVMSTRAVHEGLRVVEIPIPYKERLGRSKLNVVRDGLRFLQTILWTAMNYNPVRILGGLGAVCMAAAAWLALIILGLRFAGTTSLSSFGVGILFAALILAFAGVDLFALGVTFNYLVSLFHKRPVRKGLFGKPVFKKPLEQQFWWMGLGLMMVGAILGLISFLLGFQGWPVERLWFYLLTSSMLVLLGLQLFTFWIIVQVLDELNRRETDIQNDLIAQ
jgi:glycosyltransferase involved in cell wall biosynthesis